MRSQALSVIVPLAFVAGCHLGPPVQNGHSPAGFVSQAEFDHLQGRFDALLAEHQTAKRSPAEPAAVESSAISLPLEFAGLQFEPIRAVHSNPTFAGWEYTCLDHPHVRLIELRQSPARRPPGDIDTWGGFCELELISRNTQVRHSPRAPWINHGLSVTYFPRGNSLSFYEMGRQYTGRDNMGVAIPPRGHEWPSAE